MRNFVIPTIIIGVAGLLGFSVVTKQIVTKPESEAKENYIEVNQQKNLRQATLKIDGMFCTSCATGAEYALKEMEGVVDASVDYDSGIGKVIYDPSKISMDELVQTIKPYTATITKDTTYKYFSRTN